MTIPLRTQEEEEDTMQQQEEEQQQQGEDVELSLLESNGVERFEDSAPKNNDDVLIISKFHNNNNYDTNNSNDNMGIVQGENSSSRIYSSNINNNSNSNNTDNDQQLRMRHWKESPFAVGLTPATWADERKQRLSRRRKWGSWCNSPTAWTAVCCPQSVGRVGNMVVLVQRMETITTTTPSAAAILPVAERSDDTNNETSPQPQQSATNTNTSTTTTTITRPRLVCVMGPYWMVWLCLTLPLVTGVSALTAITRLLPQLQRNDDDDDANPQQQQLLSPTTVLILSIAWLVCTAILYLSLCLVACTDPGILYRTPHPPPTPSTTAADDNIDKEVWLWNDQALTFRPSSAKYDPECAVVIEQFDHTCPWTGTAIGKNNMFWFRLFVIFIVVCVILNASILGLL